MNDVLRVALDALRVRVTRVFPEQIRAAVRPLTDEQVWWRPNERSNSIGNILLHLNGSLDHYLNRNLGGIDFERDRPAEFATRQVVPRDELLAAFDGMVARAERTFASLTLERLAEASPEPSMHSLVVEDLINVASHLSNHTGQIVWIAKMLAEGSADEVWIRSHREQGAWKQKPR